LSLQYRGMRRIRLQGRLQLIYKVRIAAPGKSGLRQCRRSGRRGGRSCRNFPFLGNEGIVSIRDKFPATACHSLRGLRHVNRAGRKLQPLSEVGNRANGLMPVTYILRHCGTAPSLAHLFIANCDHSHDPSNSRGFPRSSQPRSHELDLLLD
jgi:hypothetical protein